RVGVDIEIPTHKTERIQHKFLHESEQRMLEQWKAGSEKQGMENKDVDVHSHYRLTTLIWSAKEAMFKWWGYGNIDFSEMLHVSENNVAASGELKGLFNNPNFQTQFPVHYKFFPQIVLAYIFTAPSPK
ncbi:MAG TPA: 4'-phosphopantetheinyl transferase superfamily protein, partial [Chitinophagaceae bacterium]